MENLGEWERKTLINELIQGMKLAKQLQLHLNSPSSSSSSSSSPHGTREVLAMRILASYEKALSILNWRSMVGEPSPVMGSAAQAAFHKSESPPPSLGGGSPPSGDSDREQEHGDAAKKRKSMARWTKQIRVGPGVDLEGPLDDGYSWRKYGQKDILGAKFPRGYYRCTHRNVQGCLATKQVQRSDDDPMVYGITYRGRHTCNQSSRGMNTHWLVPDNQEPVQQVGEPAPEENIQQQQTSQDVLLNFCRGLRFITEELDPQNQPLSPPPFNFPSPGDLPHPCMPLSGIGTSQGNFDQGSFRISGSDHLGEIVAAANSRTNSNTARSDFDNSRPGFNQNSPFGSPGFFN